MRRTLMTILTIMVATMMGFAKNPWDFLIANILHEVYRRLEKAGM